MRVLVVEDDAAARQGLTQLVRAWGYEADSAAVFYGLDWVATVPPTVRRDSRALQPVRRL